MMISFNHIFLDPNIEPGTICRVPIVFSRIQTTPALKKTPMGRIWNKIYCDMNSWSNTIWNNRLICRNLYNNLEEYTWSVPNSSTAYIQVGSKFWNIYSVFFRPLALIKHSKHRDSSAEVFVSTRPWRVGLFCFGSGSGRFWPKSSGFRFGYCAYCGLKKSLVILCNSISCKGAELMLKKNWNIITTYSSLQPTAMPPIQKNSVVPKKQAFKV